MEEKYKVNEIETEECKTTHKTVSVRHLITIKDI